MWCKKVNLISLYKGEEGETMTSTRVKMLLVSLRIQVRSEVVGQTRKYRFKDIVKKTVTTLGKEKLKDNKRNRIWAPP